LEGLRREVRFLGVELAAFAGAHNLVGVPDCRGPIEALSKDFTHKGPRGSMVPALPLVGVLE